jgi:hypothetical protein
MLRLTPVFLATALTVLALSANTAAEQFGPNQPSSTKIDCPARLALKNITAERFAAVPAPPYPACKIADPVVLISVKSPAPSAKTILFPDRPLLSCAMAERLGKFSMEIAAPLAASAYGSAIASVSTGPGYECRPRNRQAGAKISSHGQGNAVDIAAMELADGRTISVEKPDGAGSVKFLASLRVAACAAFNTVLGPGSDASHANHIHIDIEPRGKKGDSKFCQ